MEDLYFQNLKPIVTSDAFMMEKLRIVASLKLPDCWIGAGFVRNKVWDFLHGYEKPTELNDVDVIFFDSKNSDMKRDWELDAKLLAMDSTVNWSVKNQARMHLKQGHKPYKSSEEAVSYWVETPTCVAVRLNEVGEFEAIYPHGLNDLFELKVYPTKEFQSEKASVYKKRIEEKNWGKTWHKLQIFIP
ncbi:nucleotidyltransferase family protein [Flexithrix dorotheae]|uniref:nucleotidyltransferase family protein n=1 Tax=Flexithrix dorotheae TaxID=70993 RepID=UPI00036262EB|nr:nucleotidyltransferase family protein [Flexithrix dorotheae]